MSQKNTALIDLTGRRFGRLRVVARCGADHRGVPFWTCKCDCGTLRMIRGPSLRNGQTKSCGCLQTETMKYFGFQRMRRDARDDHDSDIL